ncbi:MAG: hypothetical protein ACHQ2Z_10295 [Elusimicrobiota bacterium]
MRFKRAELLIAALGACLAGASCRSFMQAGADSPAAAKGRGEAAQAMIAQWSGPSKLAARLMVEKYGIPDDVRYERLDWNLKGPWRRSVVRNVRPFYVQTGPPVVEQAIYYPLTAAQAIDAEAVFGDSVRFDPGSGELSVRSDREEYNFLTMNLVHDVLTGATSPENARDSYARLLSLAQSGKTSPYLLGLRFLK